MSYAKIVSQIREACADFTQRRAAVRRYVAENHKCEVIFMAGRLSDGPPEFLIEKLASVATAGPENERREIATEIVRQAIEYAESLSEVRH